MGVSEVNNSLLNKNHNFTSIEKVGVWIHEHPTTVKIMKVAALVLGLALLASLPFTAPFLAAGIVATIAITGILLTLSSTIAILALDLIAPPHHDMKNHVYKPGKCEGGELYYDGDVPVLALESDDPFQAGKAHGFLCGDAINRLSKRFAIAQPRADRIPKTLAILKSLIPNEYKREIEGTVEGYNEWAKKQPFWKSTKKLTFDDALVFHLLPDSTHFNAREFEGNVGAPILPELAVACSALIEQDAEKGFVLARNMDWPSLGLAGTYSLVIHRKHKNGLHNTMEVGVPGLVGTITGINGQGLSLCENVCYGKTEMIQGLPSCLFNRVILEKCGNVDQVEEFVANNSPLGPYNLTLADSEKAASIHFYQGAGGNHAIRRQVEGKPFCTLNYCYTPAPNYRINFHRSIEREMELGRFFNKRENRPLEEALSLPLVNNWLTTHRVVMEPRSKSMRVAFDNAFAGRIPLQVIKTPV